MQASQDIEARFGAEAAAAVAPRIGTPPTGDPTQSPASQDRIRGSLVGAAIGTVSSMLAMTPRSVFVFADSTNLFYHPSGLHN